MKKIAFGLFAALTLASASSFATPITNGASITDQECAILGESVRLTLSNNVDGAYNCDEIRNAANVGACHFSGSRSDTLICAEIGKDQNGDPVYNENTCQQSGDSVTLTTPSYRGYRASTTGGSVGAQSLSANCATGVADAQLVNFQ